MFKQSRIVLMILLRQQHLEEVFKKKKEKKRPVWHWATCFSEEWMSFTIISAPRLCFSSGGIHSLMPRSEIASFFPPQECVTILSCACLPLCSCCSGAWDLSDVLVWWLAVQLLIMPLTLRCERRCLHHRARVGWSRGLVTWRSSYTPLCTSDRSGLAPFCSQRQKKPWNSRNK